MTDSKTGLVPRAVWLGTRLKELTRHAHEEWQAGREPTPEVLEELADVLRDFQVAVAAIRELRL